MKLLNYLISLILIVFLIVFVPLARDVAIAISVTIFVIKLAGELMEITRKYIFHKRVSSKNKVVLITGCDTGFGNKLARRLDKLGYSVLATCLFPEGDGAKKLSEDCSERLSVLHMDVTDEESIRKVKLFVEKFVERDALWAIVNNAGIVQYGAIEWTSVEEIQRVCDVNTFGAIRVIKAFLPFIKQSKGRIVNVTSVAGHCAIPTIAAYCLSKSAAISLTNSLQMELHMWGIKCISIEPVMYATPIANKQTVLSMAQRTWDAAPKAIREEYGEDFFDRLKTVAGAMISLFTNNNVSEVIDSLEDAITAEDPLSAYVPGSWLHRICFQTLNGAPSEVKMNMFRFCVHFSRKLAALITKVKKSS